MPIWISDVSALAYSPGIRNFALDNLLSLTTFVSFSVIQGQIVWEMVDRLRTGHLKKAQRSVRIIGASSIVLGIGYIIGSVLILINFATRTYQVPWDDAQWKVFGNHPKSAQIQANAALKICSSLRLKGVNDADYPACVRVVNLLTRTFDMDIVTNVLFHFMLILADGLLVYRCYMMLKRPFLMTGLASLPLIGSLGVLLWFLVNGIRQMKRYSALGPYEALLLTLDGYSAGLLYSFYISLGTSIVVTTTLIYRLWKENREAKRLLGDSPSNESHWPYKRLIVLLLSSALPPLLLGLVHLVVFLGFRRTSQAHGALWVSFTILAPQIIAIRAIQKSDERASQDTEPPPTTKVMTFRRVRSYISTRMGHESPSTSHGDIRAFIETPMDGGKLEANHPKI